MGFAAEHGGDPVAEARAKLERKGLDAVVVNDISRGDIGFDTEENEVVIVTATGQRPVPRGPKSAVAAAVLDEVETLRRSAGSAASAEGRGRGPAGQASAGTTLGEKR